MIAIAAVLAVAAGSGRVSLGVHDGWAAFRDATPRRCFAIAEPLRAGAAARWHPFASVAAWPDRGRRGVLFIRLSAARAPGVPVTLSVGERRFTLIGEGSGAWSADAATDRAIVAALRGERSMSVEAVTAAGRPFADTYPLKGAATAIDAATLGCTRR